MTDILNIRSTITCPHCGFAAEETMPTDACQFFYDCKGCGALLRPNPGDCCVFCSFGSVPCPPVQENGGCHAPALECCPADRPSATIRPGVSLPDWSEIGTPAARKALDATVATFGVLRMWDGIDDTEDKVWRAVLRGYSRIGQAPTLGELAQEVRIDLAALGDILERLRNRDLIVLDAGQHIVGAYPFAGRATGYRVAIGPETVNAQCAIDALGIGAMLDVDSVICSACHYCSAPIEIATRTRSIVLDSPEGVVIWSGAHEATGCAATSLCTVQLFFCSGEHLKYWCGEAEARSNGVRLSLNEAMQVAHALFAPMLRVIPQETVRVSEQPHLPASRRGGASP